MVHTGSRGHRWAPPRRVTGFDSQERRLSAGPKSRFSVCGHGPVLFCGIGLSLYGLVKSGISLPARFPDRTLRGARVDRNQMRNFIDASIWLDHSLSLIRQRNGGFFLDRAIHFRCGHRKRVASIAGSHRRLARPRRFFRLRYAAAHEMPCAVEGLGQEHQLTVVQIRIPRSPGRGGASYLES